MKVYFDPRILGDLTNGYIFLDNDFLSQAFYDEEVFNFLTDSLSSVSYLMIDPLTEFEFRRDVYIPKQIELRRDFIAQPIFAPVLNHQDLYAKIQENALLLSQIYAHQQQNQKISLVDIYLAARLMYLSHPAFLITGNKKDFPSCVFDTIGIFNIEQNDGQIKPIGILKFNREKFEKCYLKLQRLSIIS